MEENRLLECMWQEAQQVEIPPELAPEQMKERICSQPRMKETRRENKNEDKRKNKGGNKDKNGNKHHSKNVFRWHGCADRVAAAAVVLAVSFGTFTLAERQTATVGDDAAGVTVPGTTVARPTADGDGLEGENQTEVLDGESDERPADSDGQSSEETLVSATELGGYHQADSYEEVGHMFRLSKNGYAGDSMTTGLNLIEGAADDSAGAYRDSDTQKGYVKQNSASASADTAASDDYSATNLQVEGVDESDIVKTDGQYIYIAADRQVRIVDTAGGQVRQLGSITPKLEGNLDTIREMYVSDNRMILIVQTEDTEQTGENTSYATDDEGQTLEDTSYAAVDIDYCPQNQMHTKVLTYDISIPAGAQLIGTFEQDGTYHTSRKIGDRVYLFTNYFVDTYQLYAKMLEQMDDVAVQDQGLATQQTRMYPSGQEVRNALPEVQGETIPSDCIYLPEQQSMGGVLMASFNVNAPETVCDQKLIFSGYSTMYVTQDSVILYRSEYSEAVNNITTALTKFRISGGQIVADCAESVEGEISDTFALHENEDGHLYVLTTDYTTNWLYVLDDNLKITGEIDHIADGESVYAARFIDQIGYFVTYRNTDPLFTVDFSDPANPTLIGELEIPGFSDYLQFWDDTHLIGVGEERKAEDSEYIGMKLSLYDISDPTNVTESDKVVLKDAAGAPAAYNYKALLADSTKNVIAFLTDDKGEQNNISERVYRVDDGRLREQRAERIVESEDYSRNSDAYRNVYIGDYLYLVCADEIIVYDMTDKFTRIGAYDLQ